MIYGDRAPEIGQRIKKNRKMLNMTQMELLEKVYLSEKSVASLRKWEKGERLPDLETLARMAEVFDCDIGYLLCDYDEKHHVTADIREQTGLSEEAVVSLLNLNPKDQAIDALSSILAQPDVEQWLSQIFRIAGETSVCDNLKNALKLEHLAMISTESSPMTKAALEYVAIPAKEYAVFQEAGQHSIIINSVVLDLCNKNAQVKEYGVNGIKRAISAVKYRLEENENG